MGAWSKSRGLQVIVATGSRPYERRSSGRTAGSGRPTAAAPRSTPQQQQPTPSKFDRLFRDLTEAADANLLKTAYGWAYKAHEKKEITDDQFRELTRIKDERKAKLAAPAA